jgi:hypothetical protein
VDETFESWEGERQTLMSRKISELGLAIAGTRVEKMIDQLYADNAEFYADEPGDAPVERRGRAEIMENITQVNERLTQGKRLTTESTAFAENHDLLRVSWKMTTPHGDVALTGMNLLLRDRAGQVVRDYKERKVSQGIFAVRCAATGETWVGKSRNLDQQQNRIWFGLRAGGYINPVVQAAWKANGEGAFTFEVLEMIEDADLSDYSRANLLKERDAHWRAQLGAPKLVG